MRACVIKLALMPQAPTEQELMLQIPLSQPSIPQDAMPQAVRLGPHSTDPEYQKPGASQCDPSLNTVMNYVSRHFETQHCICN